MSCIKNIAGSFSYILFITISVVLLLEAIFRILPTTSLIDLQPINSEQEILSFKADQTATFSLGANFYKTVTKRTNNVGFYSNFDYEKGKSPNIVIIGDSYIEAAQIDNTDTVGEIIAKDEMQSVYQMGLIRRAVGRLTELLRCASQLKHPFTAPTLKPTSERRPLRGYHPPGPPPLVKSPWGHPTVRAYFMTGGGLGLRTIGIMWRPITIS